MKEYHFSRCMLCHFLSLSRDEHIIFTIYNSGKVWPRADSIICMPYQSESVGPAHNLRACLFTDEKK